MFKEDTAVCHSSKFGFLLGTRIQNNLFVKLSTNTFYYFLFYKREKHIKLELKRLIFT